MADNKMVTVSQTEYEVKILIELTNVIKSRPAVVVLNNFVKFNCPPVYFESFLYGDVDEDNSVCQLFKKQARIILKKKDAAMWPNILEKVPREVALKKKIELNDLIVERTQKEDKERSEQFDMAKKEKLQHQIDREMSIHDKLKEFKETCVAESMGGSGKKDDPQPVKEVKKDSNVEPASDIEEPRKVYRYVAPATNNLRKTGKIQISFSTYTAPTPKRESQEQALAQRNIPNPNMTIY